LPVAAAADLEELVVCFLKDAQDIGQQLAGVQLWRAQRIATRWPTSAAVTRTTSR
jgi:hypothetical protein